MRSGSASLVQVVTVGASVEPYARLTMQPKASRARRTKAGVTLAPPMERNRKEAVRLGLKSGWSMRSLKKVGGPIM